MSDDRLKMWFGFAMMVGLLILAAAIALGKVEEKSSFGLNQVLGGLLVMAGAFSQWAFSKGKE